MTSEALIAQILLAEWDPFAHWSYKRDVELFKRFTDDLEVAASAVTYIVTIGGSDDPAIFLRRFRQAWVKYDP